MRPIQAQLYTGWKQMAKTNWITVGDGSQVEMDCGRHGSRLEMDDRRWISGDGSQEIDLRRWITGNR